jgi:PhzF family phenazine biosynthesis protein
MRHIPFFVVDSFTDTPFQGNPAGVFFDSNAALTGDEMRRLAGEVHLESAFVLPADPSDPGPADFRLRYFTGVCEVSAADRSSSVRRPQRVDEAVIRPD